MAQSGGTHAGTARRLIAGLAAALILSPAIVTPVATAVPVASAQVQLLATEALIMTGTDMHIIDAAWLHTAIVHYIEPTLGGEYTAVALSTPEEFWPFGGIFDESLSDSVDHGTAALEAAIADAVARNTAAGNPDAEIVVFGYSQSAMIVTEEKRRLAAAAAAGERVPPVTFVMIANPSRPNGGVGERLTRLFPNTGFQGATLTDTPFPTIDIARQYDPFSDFPLYPLNPFAMANTFVALLYMHDYRPTTLDPTDPHYNPNTVVEHYGDTTYYFIPAEHLPLLQPLRDAGVPAAMLDKVEPTLKAWVELGYDRTIPAGEPTPARPFRPVTPSASRPATTRSPEPAAAGVPPAPRSRAARETGRGPSSSAGSQPPPNISARADRDPYSPVRP